MASLPLAALLFALSGAGALIVETTWLRWLRLLFGATAPAASATLAAFFAGQALGAAWGARLARRAAVPLRRYAALELLGAGGALAVPLLLGAGEALTSVGYDALRSHPAALSALRFAVALGATLPAACAFGATLPVLGAAVVGRGEALGRRGTALYGANTLGAALGVVAAAFVLPPRLGVRGCYAAGIALLLLAAFGAALLARRPGAAVPGPARPGREPVAAGRAEPGVAARSAGAWPGVRGLAALAALSGFGALAAQVLLVASFALVVDQSTQAFGAVLATVLLSLALGALATAALARSGALDPRQLLALALGAAGLGLAAFPALFVGASALQPLAGGGTAAGYALAIGALAARSAGPALLAAALVFPAVLSVAARSDPGAHAGARLGMLAAANTVGALLGALAAPSLLLPVFGLWGAFAVLGGVLALGALAVAQPAPRARLVRNVVLGLGWLAVLSAANPRSQPVVRVEPGEELVALAETPAGVVAAIARAGELRLQTDNHYLLGGSAERLHEERQGHLPLLLHPEARRVAFVGAATGISAGAALAHPIEHLALVEIVPAVAELAATWFGRFNRDVYADARVETVLDDGRNFLRSTRERFDVVIADLFVPWRAGTGALWSREHFSAVRERLRPGGLFCQWLPLYQLTEDDFRSVLASFLDVFPRAALWRGDFYGSFPIVALVGHADEPASAGAIAAAAARLGRAGEPDRWVSDPVGVFSLYVAPLGHLRRTLGDTPRNRDDWPAIEFGAPEGRAAGSPRLIGLRLAAFVEQLRGTARHGADPIYPDLPPAALRASDGGTALQLAGALFSAGRTREAGRLLERAAQLLPAHLLAEASADPSAAEVWADLP